MMRSVVGFGGSIDFDTSKPDGTPRKVLDVSKVRGLGWTPSYSLPEGLRATYSWALANGIFESRSAAAIEHLVAA
jgi:GDP-L-fucose synthase